MNIPINLNVAVLYSSYGNSSSPFKEYDSDYVDLESSNPKPDRFKFHGIPIDKTLAGQQIKDLALNGQYNLIMNFCDGYFEEDRAGSEVVDYLDQYCSEIPVSSCSKSFFLLNKRQTKSIAFDCGVLTPKYFFTTTTSSDELTKEVETNVKYLKFPLLVKHHNGYGSLGMTAKSKVYSMECLLEQVLKTVGSFAGALIEEFIVGPEFTVLVSENCEDPTEPLVYQPFISDPGGPEAFKHFDVKFVNWKESLTEAPVLDDDLCKKLKDITKRLFLACGGEMFARCDYRMCQKTGEIYFLEINSQCGIFLEGRDGCADYILSYTKDHSNFIENLIKLAFKNFQVKKSYVKHLISGQQPEPQFLKTRKKFKTGELILNLLALPHSMVSKWEYDTWPDVKRMEFLKNSFKINDFLRLHLIHENLPSNLTGWLIKRNSAFELTNCHVSNSMCIFATKDIEVGDFLILKIDY